MWEFIKHWIEVAVLMIFIFIACALIVLAIVHIMQYSTATIMILGFLVASGLLALITRNDI